jgi:hypothetical protein
MSIDWKDVWAAAVTAAEDVVKAKAPAAKGFVRDVMQARERRLKLLMIAWADGALDEDTLEAELAEEQDILEMEFLAIQVMVKKAAQDAANAAFKVIGDALLKGIGLVV